MKKIFQILLLAGIACPELHAQNIGINATGATPDASAILDVSATSKGMLVPRMTTAQRMAIVTPAKGLLVFDNITNTFWYYNGNAWLQLTAPGNSGWILTGNAGTDSTIHFIGTTDNQPLQFRVNNIRAGIIHPANGNIFLGLYAGLSNSTGSANTALGDQVLRSNTAGRFNTGMGNQTLFSNTTGSSNTASGHQALYSNTTGSNNVANGRWTLYSNTSGTGNTGAGVQALYANNTGSSNTAMGFDALTNNSTGDNNTATGDHALYTNFDGQSNTANGYQSLYANTSGSANVATGYQALAANTNGSGNTANGYQALLNADSKENTAIGHKALYLTSSGDYNTAIGAAALTNNSTGTDNTATGRGAMQLNNTGSDNTAIGYSALFSNSNGNQNTAVGVSALGQLVDGYRNIAIGYYAGTHPNSPNVTNTISIGNDDYLNGASNQAFIGNTRTTFIGGKVTWSTFSDARIKNSVEEDVKGLDFILKLRPVTYHVSNQAIARISGNKIITGADGRFVDDNTKYSGFLAQEVEQAARATHYEFSGYTAPQNKYQLYTLSYEQFVVPLVKAMQEQQAMMVKLQQQLALLEQKISTLK